VLSTAREIGPRAIAYAENLIGDPAVALTCLEEAAASVSAVIAEKHETGTPAVRNVSAYLFRTFIHRIDKAKQRKTSLEQSLQEYGATEFATWEESREETWVLLNEIMAICGEVSGRIVMLHLEGWSWDEIGERLGISRHAAETRYRKALDRARKTLKIQK
jgi:DNA-directed RNA polymerase specialized sigma24 family protein